MDVYTATEEAYKKGYARGFEDGEKEAIKHMCFEEHLDSGHNVVGAKWIKCTTCKMFYYSGHNYCPNCGTKGRKLDL